jgi:hypothetical protein
MAAIRTTSNNTMIIPNIIHIGLNTHHHDQLMKFVSFKPINRIVNNPTNPIPPEELVVLEFVLMICITPFFYIINF